MARVRQGRVTREAGEAEASGPGAPTGARIARYNENFPPLWRRNFYREKLRFLLATYLRKDGNRTKISSILPIFYEGPAVAFKPQGLEGP